MRILRQYYNLFLNLWFERILPWRCREQGGLLRYFFINPLRRRFFLYHFSKINKKEDITAVIGVKDRCDYRIVNALKSIRNQDYPKELIKIILVDYDSKKELMPRYKKLCKRYNVEYIRVNNQLVWSRAHCLNIGIKKAKTKYVLTSDVDIIFEENYIREAIKELQKNPCQVILSNYFDARSNDIDKKRSILNYDILKPKGKLIPSSVGCGINLTLTYFYHRIRGYDERYKIWGAEDDDLIKRFKFLGLRVKDLSNKTIFIHQWHPNFEGVKNKNLKEQINENREYLKRSYSIIRNKSGWGNK